MFSPPPLSFPLALPANRLFLKSSNGMCPPWSLSAAQAKGKRWWGRRRKKKRSPTFSWVGTLAAWPRSQGERAYWHGYKTARPLCKTAMARTMRSAPTCAFASCQVEKFFRDGCKFLELCLLKPDYKIGCGLTDSFMFWQRRVFVKNMRPCNRSNNRHSATLQIRQSMQRSKCIMQDETTNGAVKYEWPYAKAIVTLTLW